MIPASKPLDQSTIATLLDLDPLIADYRAFFALLDWSVAEGWEAERPPSKRPAHPESAYLKAFLLRIREGMNYTAQLRRFLLRHPLLVIELGFRLYPDPTAPYGFNLEKTVPCDFWLREKLRHFDRDLLRALLQTTVRALKARDSRPGRKRRFRREAHLWVGEREQ